MSTPLVDESHATTAVETEQPILFFDGVCGLCNWSVDFVIRRDRRRRLRFAPLQGETARSLLNTAEGQDFHTVVLYENQRQHRKSDAAWRVLVELGGIWSVAGTLLRLIPRPLRNWGYDIVASNRYRWFGRKETCRLPAPEERQLFLP